MTEEKKKRTCLRCRQEKPETDFQYTPSNYFPAHRCYICTSCLEVMAPADNLGEVDRLMRWLDLPFDLDKWTKLYETHGGHTLSAYFNLLLDDHYSALQWSDENERWRMAREEGTIDDEIEVLNEARARKLKKTWSSAYNNDELEWLDSFYNRIAATQNVSTPILQEKARDFCELQLHIKNGLRSGQDVSKMMKQADDIVKTYHFEASNAKNVADFESVGELMVYYGKKGWHPKWHNEPKDSIDFMMQNIQNYLKRLVINEGNFAEQVEDERERYNLTERLEAIENEAVETEDTDIEYEGADELESDLNE